MSSVSCIYGLGEPENFEKMMVSLRPGMSKDRDEVLRQLIDIQYDRNEIDFKRGTFRVRGDVVEIIPANEEETAIRVEFFGDEIDRITQIDVLTGEIKGELEHVAIFPASHYVVRPNRFEGQLVPLKRSWKNGFAFLKGRTSFRSSENCREN